MTTPAGFRERFPIFRSKIFLNSCSKGALSTDVENAYAAYLDSWRGLGSPWEDWVDLLERTRAVVAQTLGCDSDEIAVSYCASTATAGLLSALSFSGERHRIVVDDFQFPTMAHNFLAQQKRGAEIVRLRAQAGALSAESYAGVLDERVSLVPVSHVCFRNGYRQDLNEVVRKAREVGAYSLVDDYQSTGTSVIDVKKLGCDFLVTGTLKYLLGSSGVGFLYVKGDLARSLEPVTTGWFAQKRPFDFDIERATHHASARRFETGTPAVPNLYAALAGLELLQTLSIDAVARHIDTLSSGLIRGAHERGVRVLTPDVSERRGPLVVLGCTQADELVEALASEGIIVSARGAGLRVSFHYYNLQEDIDALWQVLDRFPQYLERS